MTIFAGNQDNLGILWIQATYKTCRENCPWAFIIIVQALGGVWEKECIHQDRLGFAEIINVSKFQQLSITKLDFQLTQDQGQVTSSLFHLRTRGLGSLHLCCHHFNIWLSASPGQRKREFMDYTLALKCLIWEMICATKVCISLSRTSHTAPAN